jgi:hypothetical protein
VQEHHALAQLAALVELREEVVLRGYREDRVGVDAVDPVGPQLGLATCGGFCNTTISNLASVFITQHDQLD